MDATRTQKPAPQIRAITPPACEPGAEAPRRPFVKVMLPVSEFEYELILTVNRATFVPGSAHKRFIREFADGRRLHLSARGRQYLATIAHRYRRQYHLSDAQWAWIREWLSCSIPADERQMPRINSVSERPAEPGEASAVKAGACEAKRSAPGLS